MVGVQVGEGGSRRLSRNEWMWCKSTGQSLRRMIAQRRDFATAAARGCRWMTTRQRASLRSGEARRLPARSAVERRARDGADSVSGCTGSD